MTRFHVGTSGWSYPEWKGSFYPAEIKADAMLAYYAARFDSVEVNNTFYRLPRAETLAAWAAQVPEGFTFAVKASQKITHHARLGPEAEAPLRVLLDACAALGDRVGPLLIQTPPYLKRDLGRLRDFLAWLPPGVRAAFEFRHVSWFEEAVHAALADRNAALVAADTGDEGDPPLVRTADWGYARLRRVEYPGDLLEQWAERLRAMAWERAWVFFKHEDEGTGPRLGARFRALVGT